jgi:hypothetical protein
LPAEGSNPSVWPALDKAFISAMALSDAERADMGACGKRLIEKKYTWSAVSRPIIEEYKRICGD